MTLKSFVALSLTSLAAYKLYQNRERIKRSITSLQESKKAISFDLDKMKGDLALIQNQTQLAQQIGQDLSHKWRLFNQEAQPHLVEIQRRMEAYQQN
ncbi:chemotaxis protein [Streptococcus phocae subsp. phocae]